MSSPSANGRLLLLTFQSRVTKCSKRTRQGRFCCSFPWKLDCAIKSTGRLCKAASPFPWRRTRCSAPRCSPLDLANVTKAKPRSPWLYWNRIKTRMEKSAEHLLASISTSLSLCKVCVGFALQTQGNPAETTARKASPAPKRSLVSLEAISILIVPQMVPFQQDK